jgi:hypothetical protein
METQVLVQSYKYVSSASHVCVCVCVCVCVRARTHTHTHIHTHTHTYIYICIHICMYGKHAALTTIPRISRAYVVCVYVCMCVCKPIKRAWMYTEVYVCTLQACSPYDKSSHLSRTCRFFFLEVKIFFLLFRHISRAHVVCLYVCMYVCIYVCMYV